MTKDFREDLIFLENKLRNKEPFSFARYGDGEMMIMNNRFIDILNKCNGEFRFDPNNPAEQKHRQALVNAFTHQSENYYIGIACPCCVGMNNFNVMRESSRQKEDNLTWANLLVNNNYNYFLKQVVPLFSRYDVHIVCNEKANLAKLPFADSIKKEYRIGSDAWKGEVIQVDESLSGALFLLAAGPYSKILCHQMWEKNKNNTYLDIGSTLDPLLFGENGFTRGYHRGASTINKKCVWG